MIANAEQREWREGKGDIRPRAGTDERLAQIERTEQRARNSARRIAERPTVSNPAIEDIVPQEFVDESLSKIGFHLRAANWEMAKDAIDAIARLWADRQVEATPLAELPMGERLAAHVGRLRLPPRTVNLIESVCTGTVGSLLEAFPNEFDRKVQCGPATLEKIRQALIAAGVVRQIEERQCIPQ